MFFLQFPKCLHFFFWKWKIKEEMMVSTYTAHIRDYAFCKCIILCSYWWPWNIKPGTTKLSWTELLVIDDSVKQVYLVIEILCHYWQGLSYDNFCEFSPCLITIENESLFVHKKSWYFDYLRKNIQNMYMYKLTFIYSNQSMVLLASEHLQATASDRRNRNHSSHITMILFDALCNWFHKMFP